MPQCDNRAVLHLIDKALEYRQGSLSSSPMALQVLEFLREQIVDGKMDVTLTEPLEDVVLMKAAACCYWHTFCVSAVLLSTGRINCGIDGRLIGVAETPEHAERMLAEELRYLSRDRMRSVVLPSQFRQELQAMASDVPVA